MRHRAGLHRPLELVGLPRQLLPYGMGQFHQLAHAQPQGGAQISHQTRHPHPDPPLPDDLAGQIQLRTTPAPTTATPPVGDLMLDAFHQLWQRQLEHFAPVVEALAAQPVVTQSGQRANACRASRVGASRLRKVLCSAARFLRGPCRTGAGRFGSTNHGGPALRCSSSAIRTNAVSNWPVNSATGPRSAAFSRLSRACSVRSAWISSEVMTAVHDIPTERRILPRDLALRAPDC